MGLTGFFQIHCVHGIYVMADMNNVRVQSYSVVKEPVAIQIRRLSQ